MAPKKEEPVDVEDSPVYMMKDAMIGIWFDNIQDMIHDQNVPDAHTRAAMRKAVESYGEVVELSIRQSKERAKIADAQTEAFAYVNNNLKRSTDELKEYIDAVNKRTKIEDDAVFQAMKTALKTFPTDSEASRAILK